MYASLRATQRFSISIPVRIRRLDEFNSVEYSVETSNLSAGGMYVSGDFQLELDTPVRAYLTMPEQIFGKPILRWRCESRVVHLHPSGAPRTKLGVGLSFYTYTVLALETQTWQTRFISSAGTARDENAQD
jgi:PilZ domain